MDNRFEDLLFDRSALIDEMVARGDEAARGHGLVLLLTGEAGIGKTSVVRALTHQVSDRLAISWGSCVADRSAPPLWPWRALVPAAAIDRVDDLESAIGAQRYSRLSSLRDQIHDAASQQPRLHIIEDLQWADVNSVLLLSLVASSVTDLPIFVVTTVRTGEPRDPQLETALEDVRRAAIVRELSPLGSDAIAALARHGGLEPEAQLIERLRVRTGGNPFFVSELIRTVATGDDSRADTIIEQVPERVSDLVERRLQRLPSRVVDVLTTAAVIGTQGELGVIADVHRADPATVLDLLDQARAAHFLDLATSSRWQFRHQLIRDAVYRRAPPVERSRLHAAVLESIAGRGIGAPALFAHHALAAQPAFDADRAVALAARAGEAAFGEHAYEEAIDWFTRALAATPPGTAHRWSAELLVRMGEAQRHVGNIKAARDSFVLAAGLDDEPALTARAALGYADPGADLGIAYRSEDPRTAALLQRALDLQPSLDSVTGVQLEARLAAELYFSDRPERARELARSSVERAHRLGDPHAIAIAAAVAHDMFVVGQSPLSEQLEESNELLAWARRSKSVAGLLSAHRARVIDLLAAGDLAALDSEIVAFRRVADPLRAPGYLWWPHLWSAMRSLLEGRHDEAETRAVEAYRLAESVIPELAFVNLTFLLFFLRREQGRLEELEAATRDYAATHADVPALRAAHAFLLAETGRTDEAAGALRSFDDVALARLRDRNWPASWFQLARVASIVGDRAFAATLLDERRRPTERCIQVSLGTVCLGATDLAVAWLLETVDDLDGAAAHYGSAAELNSRIGARSWLAQTRADHARLLVARDRPEDRETALRLRELATDAARSIGLVIVGSDVDARPRSRSVHQTFGFRRDGTIWHLEYANRTINMSDTRGMRDIAYLLARPGEAVSVLELSDDRATAHGSARGAPALDERARREIRARLRALDDDEADAESVGDRERAARARDERQTLAEAVARDLGIGGRSRLVGDPVERARKTVSTRIRRTIVAIGRAHPELGRHLERSIDTGSWCAYRPADHVDWHI